MKITKLKEIYIVVMPLLTRNRDRDEWQAKQTLEQIQRHIDFEAAYIERKTETACSHCGLTWEADELSGEPVCCTKAQEEWQEKLKREIMAETNGPPEHFGHDPIMSRLLRKIRRAWQERCEPR